VAQAATFSTTVVTGDDAGEPGIDVGKDGAIYINAPSGLLSNLPGSPSWIYKSTDSGASWTKLGAGLRANLPRGGDVDLSIAPGNLIAEGGGGLLGSSDKVGLIYATSTGGIKFARSTNGGLTFSNTEVSPASSADTGQAFPVVANAGGGNLDAVWLEVAGNAS